MKNDTALLPFTFILLGFVAYCGLIIFCSGQVMPEEAFIILLGGVMSCSYLFDKARAKFDINRKNSKDKIIESARESSTKTVEGIIPTNRITSKYLYILISLFGLSIVFIILYFNDIACHFYGVTKDANGQLLTVLLTCIGGCGAIYGLYLNSKRIKEQTRQNDIARIQAGTAKKQADIAVNNNNDKRFGDAIGYLNSDNVGIAIGGAYALFQLVKEDDEERYRAIVAKIYLNFLSRYPREQINDELYNIILTLLLNDTFNNETFSFQKVHFREQVIKNLGNRFFTSCTFNNVIFENSNNCNFISCTIKECILKNCSYLVLTECHISDSRFCNNELKCIQLLTNKSISSLYLSATDLIDELKLCNNNIQGKLEIASPLIRKSVIDANSLITVATNTPNGIVFSGDKNLVKVMNYPKGYESEIQL
ncbi:MULTISPECIES: pentapeptide repeat-containing protein [Bacteroides]|uniref:pentapeptide repeat-containing protein n=1 Tax=Bacteroides TaxID=816 RepID=UPI0004B57345|nr:pentapeptide repeat-containing protein [Bacteroides neonati]